MTFKEIQDELIATRFDEVQRTYVKRAINHRYSMLWGAALWPFKLVIPANITVTLGNKTVVYATVSADVERTLAMFNASGDPLEYVDPVGFYNQFQAAASGTPTAWTQAGNTLLVGPTPSAGGTYTAIYERKLYRLVGGTPTTGIMSADADVPAWNEQWHYLLVVGAMATALKMENDATAGLLEEEYQIGLKSMTEAIAIPSLPLAYIPS